MIQDDKLFLARLRETFKIEADEILKTMSSALCELENLGPDPLSEGIVEVLFREAHTLKGAARAVSLSEIETVCQTLETVLAALKQQKIPVTPAFCDVLSRTFDVLGQLTAASGGDTLPQELGKRMTMLIAALSELQDRAPEKPAPEQPIKMGERSPPAISDEAGSETYRPLLAAEIAQTVRISTTKLNSLMAQAEKLFAFKYSLQSLVKDLQGLSRDLTVQQKTWTKRMREAHAVLNASGSFNHAGECAITERSAVRLMTIFKEEDVFARQAARHIAEMERTAEKDERALASMVSALLEEMKQALMLPFSSLFEGLPMVVRDLARDNNKLVDLRISGESLEIDRRILEHLMGPLIHLLRNAIDHGIEDAAERARKGKPPRGQIAICVTPRDRNRIELSIADDGRGIDIEKTRETAQKLGILNPEAALALSPQDVSALIFDSGLSTSPILTHISGRGLGLAIVREKVEKLGGSIVVDASAAVGARFCIVLPVTLATFRGVLVRIGEHQFVLPASDVERVARVPVEMIRTAETRHMIVLDQQVFPLHYLAVVLNLEVEQAVAKTGGHFQIVVLKDDVKRLVLVVDEVLGDEEVVVKGLGPQLARVPNIAGATVLGPGRVVPILNVPDLIKSAHRTRDESGSHKKWQMEEQLARRAVLIAEDSITSRSLLKNILESAGYDVAAVADGMEALAALRTSRFDLVVSDVEMPRMDGFGLTAQIRADTKLMNLPVILVTALDSRENRERGVEAGANAYIVKRDFDPAKLLEVIRSLI